jgi:hypothetical protein
MGVLVSSLAMAASAFNASKRDIQESWRTQAAASSAANSAFF